jgi:hypothetical protein
MMQLSIVGLEPVQYIPPPPTIAEFAVIVQPVITGRLLPFPHSIAPPKTAELAVRTQLLIEGLEPLEHEIAPPEKWFPLMIVSPANLDSPVSPLWKTKPRVENEPSQSMIVLFTT